MFLYSINYLSHVPKATVYRKILCFAFLMLSMLKIYIFSNLRVFTQFENLKNSNLNNIPIPTMFSFPLSPQTSR